MTSVDDLHRGHLLILGELLAVSHEPADSGITITRGLEFEDLSTGREVSQEEIENWILELEKVGLATSFHAHEDMDLHLRITPLGVHYLINFTGSLHDDFEASDLGFPDQLNDLLTDLRDKAKGLGMAGSLANAVPASDRVVNLNHNSQSYRQAVAALDGVIIALSGDNQYGARDPEDKERRVAELTAGRKLLESTRVSLGAVEKLVLKTLAYLAAIGVATSQVADAISKVKALLGL